jgi:hypothetical protein
MPNYEVIYLVEGYKNYTYFDNKTSAYDFAFKNKPSKVLFKRNKIKEFR